MSTIIASRCWRLRLPAAPKFVLISLADQANDHGVCWPSVNTLADRTCYSVRTVQNALRWLQDQGLLDVEIGAMRANRYTLRLDRYNQAAPVQAFDPAPAAPLHDVHPPQELHPNPRRSCTPPPQELHPNRNRTNTNTSPLPPDGGSPGLDKVQTSRQRRGKDLLTLAEWLDRCREAGVKPVAPDDAIWAYCERIGLPDDYLVLHWQEFKRRHLESGKAQSDWKRRLRNSVEGNWYRLWFFGAAGEAQLTTVGIQAQLARRLHVEEA